MLTGMMLPLWYLKWAKLGIMPAEGKSESSLHGLAFLRRLRDILLFVFLDVSSASTVKANIKFYRLSFADRVCIEFAP